MEKAAFSARVVAWFIDMFMIWVLSWIVVLVLSPILALGSNSDGGLLGLLAGLASLLLAGVLFLFQFLYFGYLWSKSGQSIGMKVMNVKVVAREGGPMTFLMAGLRGSIGYWISGLVFGLGYIWAAFDAQGEAWHDKLFGTHVVPA